MSTDNAPRRDRSLWLALAGLLLLAFVCGGAVYSRLPERLGLFASKDVPTRSVPVGASDHLPTRPEETAAAKRTPSFDIVRVTPDGSAVIAGRAEPGARVIVHDGERTIGEATADQNGEFVMSPSTRLGPGGRELTLTAREADGHEVRGPESVVVIVPVPERSATSTASQSPEASTSEPALAMLVPQGDAPTRLLQMPIANRKQGLGLNTVDYDDKGAIRFSGSAKPSASVRVYVDNKPVGEASVDAFGQWTLTPLGPMQPGVHQLRVDQLRGNGRVQQRVELPFQRVAASFKGVPPGKMVVQPGQNLWRIARQTYGSGVRYTVIFLANREQIRDPNRIYPGQVFAVPPSE